MLIIFDWDGTLLNSLAKITRCMQRAAADAGLAPCSEEDIRGIIGLGLPEALETLYPDVSQPPLDALRDSYSRQFLDEDRSPCDFYPGVQDTLDRLKGEGHHLAVATGKSRRGLARVLGNLNMQDYFHATRCADETSSKPDPRMLREILDALDFAVEDALMVGDTEFDLAMAARLGMRRIGVSYGAHSRQRLSAHEPEAIIDEIGQLRELIGD